MNVKASKVFSDDFSALTPFLVKTNQKIFLNSLQNIRVVSILLPNMLKT